MSIYHVSHKTVYQYSMPVTLGHNEARLIPRGTKNQKCIRAQLFFDPWPAVNIQRDDHFGNKMTYFCIQSPHGEMTITAEHQVEIKPLKLPALHTSTIWQQLLSDLKTSLDPNTLLAREFILASPFIPIDPQFANYAKSCFLPKTPFLQGVNELMGKIHREFAFQSEVTNVSTSVYDVFQSRQGVCQDFAHLMIACLRSMGFPARYVSGYIETIPPPGTEKLAGADASHAWVSVYDPALGWADFDPTNNIMPVDQHITLAWGRDFSDVVPLKGVTMGGASHNLVVEVDVNRQDAG